MPRCWSCSLSNCRTVRVNPHLVVQSEKRRKAPRLLHARLVSPFPCASSRQFHSPRLPCLTIILASPELKPKTILQTPTTQNLLLRPRLLASTVLIFTVLLFLALASIVLASQSCFPRCCLPLRFVGLSLPVLAPSSCYLYYWKFHVTDGQNRSLFLGGQMHAHSFSHFPASVHPTSALY